jgi:CHASE2 domain-containing sensor protein
MREPLILSTWCQQLRAFDRRKFASLLRSALFLTCLTAILNQYRLLDWVDVLALKFIPEGTFEHKAPQDSAKVDTMVVGITQDLFEHQFGGHTPINRDRFEALISRLLAAYPSVRVLAIDYDLSPNIGDPCRRDAQSSACKIAQSEQAQQEQFERYLAETFSAGAQPGAQAAGASARNLGACRVQLVMITPLKERAQHGNVEQNWLARRQSGCVRFGDHALLSHNWLETVVKHAAAEATPQPCVAKDESQQTFAAVVNRARACAGVSSNMSAADGDPVKLISFAKAGNATYFCLLWQLDDISSGCERRLQSVGVKASAIKTVFIGSAYGEEDKFRTPLGDQYGVQLHAFSAYSHLNPIDEMQKIAFLIDICIGLASAFIFQLLWESAAHYSLASVRRFVLITLVFLVLIAVAWGAIRLLPWMLKLGLWMNPLMVVVGIFIDSYAGAIERVKAQQRTSEQAPAAPPGTGLKLTPMQALIGWPPETEAVPERALHFFREVLLQWSVVAMGLFFAFFA